MDCFTALTMTIQPDIMLLQYSAGTVALIMAGLWHLAFGIWRDSPNVRYAPNRLSARFQAITGNRQHSHDSWTRTWLLIWPALG